MPSAAATPPRRDQTSSLLCRLWLECLCEKSWGSSMRASPSLSRLDEDMTPVVLAGVGKGIGLFADDAEWCGCDDLWTDDGGVMSGPGAVAEVVWAPWDCEFMGR